MKYTSPDYTIRAAIYNAGAGVFKSFLDVTPQDLQLVTQTHIDGAFSFSREAILSFKDNKIEDEKHGKRGALIFTGATAALKGNTMTSAFASGKFATRALSQSLSKEFGKDNIHVAHVCLFLHTMVVIFLPVSLLRLLLTA